MQRDRRRCVLGNTNIWAVLIALKDVKPERRDAIGILGDGTPQALQLRSYLY